MRFKDRIAEAESGDPQAQNSLASYYARELKEDRAAMYWYCQACKSGLAEAKWNLGSMLIGGEGGQPRNVTIGMDLIEDAASSGENSACVFLSMCFQQGGYGKARDPDAADFWLAKSREQVGVVFGTPVDLQDDLSITR